MSILVVQQSPPYGNSHAKEALDIALAAGTFEQDVNILFVGDACYQLIDNQDPKSINQKSIAKMLKVLPIYGIDEILVDMASLEVRAISNLNTNLKIKLLSREELKSAYRSAKTVLRF